VDSPRIRQTRFAGREGDAGTHSIEARSAQGGDDSASEPQGRELVYAARVSLDRTSVDVDGRDVPRPRTAVTVEITTGAHRVITYLLSPLLRSSRIACTSVELVWPRG
jgi:hypothetical protein